jgi:hypothetical protein
MYAFLISEEGNYSVIRVVKLKDNVKIGEADITVGDHDGYYNEEEIEDKIEEEIGIIYEDCTIDSKYPVYVDKSLVEYDE